MEFNFCEAAKSATMTIKQMENEITELKFEQEITTLQLREIESCARNRIDYLLRDDPKSDEHYRIFATNLWNELKKDSCIGQCKDMTKKKDFDMVIHDIEEWSPTVGVAELMQKADRNRRKRSKKRIVATTSDGKKIIIQR